MMTAADFQEEFHFIHSDAQRETLARAEAEGKDVIATISDYPFGRYLLHLTVAE